MSLPKILFISHESSRSGAPLLLHSLIQWLIKEGKVEPVMLINRKGALDNKFKALGKTLFFYQKRSSVNRSIIFRVITRFHNSGKGKKYYLSRLKRKLRAAKPHIIYSNTLENGELLSFCRYLNLPVITHVHESEYVMALMGSGNFALNKDLTTQFIACSDIVKRDLLMRSIPPEKVKLVYSSVDTAILEREQTLQGPEVLHALSGNYTIIGGSGGAGWIKGTDFIIPLVREIKKLKPDIFFIWVGGNPTSREFVELQTEIHTAGLKEHIYLTGPVDDSMKYFSLFKVFVLLSRTDSFPLACLENVLLGNPFVCFRDRVGVQILLENKFEENIIPDLDIVAMAKRIVELINHPALLVDMGSSLKQTVLNRFTNEICFPELYKVITENYEKTLHKN